MNHNEETTHQETPVAHDSDTFCVETLKTREEITRARWILRHRGLSFVEGPKAEALLWQGCPIHVESVEKSWDVLKSVEYIEGHLAKEGSILDLGAYASELLMILHELGYSRLSGVDLNPDLVKMPFADAIDYRVGNFHHTGFLDASFDAITAVSVIEHGFNGPKLLAEISRLLKPGGVLLASVDYWQSKMDTTGLMTFGLTWDIFSEMDLRRFIKNAEDYGLQAPGPMDFASVDRTITWNERQYSFAWFLLRKVGGAPDANLAVPAKAVAPRIEPKGSHGNIAFLSTFNQPCGIATHTGYVIEGLRQAIGDTGKEMRIIVLAEESHDRTMADDETVFRCWRRDGDDFQKTIAITTQENVKVLHVQFHFGVFKKTNIEGFAAECRRKGISLFFTFHSGEEGMDLCARLANLSTASFVHLEQSAVRLIEFGAQPEKVHVVPHGIIDKLEHEMSVDEAKTSLNLPTDLRIISSIGFFEPHKGIYEIIEAFPEVLSENPNSTFFFLGGGHPGNPQSQIYMSRCRDLAVSLGISDRVIFHYNFIHDEELHRYLQASDVIVMNYTLNRNEASGACAFAMAHRRPLVVSATPPFMPLSGCTLQLSLGMGVGRAINTILERPDFAHYLISAADDYIRKNTFSVLGANLLQYYELAALTHSESTVGEPACSPISIGIDARTFYYSDSMARGIGHYSLYHLMAIIRLLPAVQFIFYSEYLDSPESLKALLDAPNVSLRKVDDYNSSDVDLFHICDPINYLAGFDSPKRIFPHPLTTVTFYDLIPLHLYLDSWSEQHRKLYLQRLEQVCKSNTIFMAISAFTGSDLIRETGIDPERVKIIMAGLNTSLSCTRPTHLQVMEVFNRLGISKPFYLHVGALDPHKNFDASAMAFIACREHTSARLVVVGEKTGHLAGYANYCAAKGIKDIVFTGFISREDLEVLYQEAVALLFMSKFEGFGFPVLEAMAKGCPVITTNVTSIPEVAGDAAIILSPDDIVGIRDAMLDLLAHPERAEELRRRGLKQADKFTWQKTGEKTIAVWEEMLSGKVMPQSINTTVISPSQPSAARSIEHIRVLLDISVLGLGYYDETSRTGVFRVVEHLAQGLAAAHEIELHFCVTQPLSENAPQTETACKEYLVQHPEFGHIPFHGMNIPLTDVFHSPFHPLPPQVNIPLRFLTIYDLIPIIYPGLYQGRYNPVPQILASLSSGDRMLCISQATKDDLCRETGIVQERSTVTHLAADPAIFYPCTDKKQQAVRQKYNMGNAPYILSLCTLEPRKNIDHVLRAFARLVRDGRAAETRLVLTGTKGWDFNRIFSEIDNNPELHTRIVLTGYVPDDDLAPLYSGATAFVYMSLYEGFGLPPLEAMQCGVPVITSNTSSLPEVVGDAGIMLDPQDMDGLCRAMHEVITNHELHTKMSKRSLLQAAHFSWDRCVEETIAAYKNALNEKEGKVGAVREPTIVIDGVIFQLQHGRPFGISRLWRSLLTELAATPLAGRIVLLDREGTAPEIHGIRRRKMSAFCLGNACNEAETLDQVCREEGGGLFVSTYYTYTLSTRSLLMLYDMIPERYQTVGPNAPNPEWRDKLHAIENSSSFAAISQSTARDLALFYPQVATRPQTVIPCAVSDAFRSHSKDEIAAFKATGGFSKRYFLLVGRHDAHKNVRLFFQAFAQLPDRERYAIVMAGAGNELEPELRELIAGADDYASFFSDQDLALLYSGALALVYPSIYEGFGLPILEAMQSGCPVITCHNSSIFEVAGRAALYVGESDVDGLAKTLLDVQQPDVRSYLIQAGLEEAQRFSWKKSAVLLAATINAQL